MTNVSRNKLIDHLIATKPDDRDLSLWIAVGLQAADDRIAAMRSLCRACDEENRRHAEVLAEIESKRTDVRRECDHPVREHFCGQYESYTECAICGATL